MADKYCKNNSLYQDGHPAVFIPSILHKKSSSLQAGLAGVSKPRTEVAHISYLVQVLHVICVVVVCCCDSLYAFIMISYSTIK